MLTYQVQADQSSSPEISHGTHPEMPIELAGHMMIHLEGFLSLFQDHSSGNTFPPYVHNHPGGFVDIA